MSDKKLTLTIVIPVYNEQNHLAVCLDAIAAQTVAADEVIVVDNNSTDKTAEIASRYKFVKLIKEPRQGVVYARSRGFDEAKSELIGRIDGDTILPPSWVSAAKAMYEKAGTPSLYALTAPSKFRNSFHYLWYVMHRVTYFWPSYLLLGHNTFVGSNMLISRKLWQKIRTEVCLRTDIHEDMDLAFHAAHAGAQVRFSPELKASVLARKMVSRTFSYPKMMFKIRSTDHRSTLGLSSR